MTETMIPSNTSGQSTQSSSHHSSHPGRGRRNRRGRGGGGGAPREPAAINSLSTQAETDGVDFLHQHSNPHPLNPALAFLPASVVTPDSQTDRHAQSNHSRRRGGGQRSRGGGRGGGPPGVRAGQTLNNGTRSFGAALTAEEDPLISQSDGHILQATAAAFTPGQPMQTIRDPKHAVSSRARHRRMSRSKADDNATRIHEDIEHRWG